MAYRFVVTAVSCTLMLMGCAPQLVWYKPGLTQAQFNKDDYACQRDASTQTGFINQGVGWFGTTVDNNLYIRCMQANGYTLQASQTTQSDQTVLQVNPEKRLVYPVVTGSGPINGDTIEKYDVIAVLNFTDAPGAPNSGNTVATILSSLVGDTGVILLERSRIEQIFEEQRLQLTSADEKVNQLKVGKLAGAKAVVVGDVDLWQTNGQASNVSLSIRMIDVETGSVLFSGVGYWPAPVKGPPQAAAQKILLGLILKLSSKIGTGTGAVGVAFDMREEHGEHIFFVGKVLPGWPGEAAGLKSGDVILTCNGTLTEKLKTKLQFIKACHADGGQSMSLEVARGDQRLLIKATAVELFKGL